MGRTQGRGVGQAAADDPAGAMRLLMAADVKPSSMDSNWEMSLIEMAKVPSLQDLRGPRAATSTACGTRTPSCRR